MKAESHAEKIDPPFGQHPFALRFIPAKVHDASYPQLYPQSRPETSCTPSGDNGAKVRAYIYSLCRVLHGRAR
jgi:hypothetical protein